MVERSILAATGVRGMRFVDSRGIVRATVARARGIALCVVHAGGVVRVGCASVISPSGRAVAQRRKRSVAAAPREE
jgi:hypothetical protein